ncbi:MAG TPA: hypothetical protein VF297_32455 [Pyrinomonadaceae bacterium]
MSRPRPVLRGDEIHPSGSVIHWDERNPNDRYYGIAVTCRQCKGKSFINKQSIRNSSWKGLCSECLSQPGALFKLSGDEWVPSGAIIHWNERDPDNPGRAQVTCSKCKANKEMMTVSSGNKLTSKFYCRECRSEERRSALAEAWSAKSRTGAASATKRGVGRPRRTPEADRQKLTTLLSRVHEEVTRLRSEGRQRSNVTANEVARYLGIGSHERGGTAMMQRATEWGLNSDWPTLRDFFWDGGQPAEVNFYSANKN